MPRKIINIGTIANDGTGDSLRVASSKTNDNFLELYTAVDNINGYSLPIASPTVLGGVKVGRGLSINGAGVLSTATTIDDLTDLGIADGNNGQVLTTDGQGNFSFQDLPSSISNLNDLTDVTINTPLVNQIIKYNGTQWVNGTAPSSVSTLDELTDVVITAASTGQVLKYNGTNWVNDEDENTGNPFDQTLNTTDDVDFQSATAEEFVLSGSGTPTVHSDTELHLSAGSRVAVVTTTPFKFPNMTSTQRDGLIAQNGDVIYNVTVSKLQVYAGGSWVNLH